METKRSKMAISSRIGYLSMMLTDSLDTVGRAKDLDLVDRCDRLDR